METLATHRFGDSLGPNRGRPTVYKGILMRSRLEAKWAASWDEEALSQAEDGVKLEWAYEPLCFASPKGQYLPDFRLTWSVGNPTYVEVKPVLKNPSPIMELMEIIHESEPEAGLMICVGDPEKPDAEPWDFTCERNHPMMWFEWLNPDMELIRSVPTPAWFADYQSDPVAASLYDKGDWAGLDDLQRSAWRNAQ